MTKKSDPLQDGGCASEVNIRITCLSPKKYWVLWFITLACISILKGQPQPEYNLKFDTLAGRWDEGIPLGNGWLGALIWKKENKLRISLDRVDLWDDRPMPEIDKLTFNWVVAQVKKGQYDTVQRLGDLPYEKYPAPTKIPGAAMEFDLDKLGIVVSNELDIKTGLSIVRFDNGVILHQYIHANRQVGYFSFERLDPGHIAFRNFHDLLQLAVPNYNSGKAGTAGNSVEGQSLERLGYPQGKVTRTPNSILYHQPTWNKEFYEVLIKWQKTADNKLIGQWTISNNKPARLKDLDLSDPEPTYWPSHIQWWEDYWHRSSVSIPDKLLERQYYLEMYKFACVARDQAPPISLQAIWTADNGNLPPWKGDFHHDLNTQLSYWPGYTANHLHLTRGYTRWLWKVKKENKKWTRNTFEMEGLNVPGVTTISGRAMGGWIQYSMSPTTSAWLAQHFYWQWKYSMDERFLKKRAYPYLYETSRFINALVQRFEDHPEDIISSSPEYFDNSIRAWFRNYTNYDLALIRHQIKIQGEAQEDLKRAGGNLNRSFTAPMAKVPGFHTNASGLMVAPGQNLDESHRHLSPYMAIHPLGLLDMDDPSDAEIITRSLHWLEQKGTRLWTGYSFSWMACQYARARMGEKAEDMLKKFAENFCSTNSFHLNGDQKGGQYSNFVYRPFTLEGNFAFAQGVHEMLLQSHKGYIEIFPAVPEKWKDIRFTTLRTEGAFLVSAKKENGNITEAVVLSEAGGLLRIKLPFKATSVQGVGVESMHIKNEITEINTSKGQILVFKNNPS